MTSERISQTSDAIRETPWRNLVILMLIRHFRFIFKQAELSSRSSAINNDTAATSTRYPSAYIRIRWFRLVCLIDSNYNNICRITFRFHCLVRVLSLFSLPLTATIKGGAEETKGECRVFVLITSRCMLTN